jgi:hypothetical protein
MWQVEFDQADKWVELVACPPLLKKDSHQSSTDSSYKPRF